MKNTITSPRFIFISFLILFAAFSRMFPHPLNFSPLGATCLFGAAYFGKKWQAFIIPLVATWLSDLFINNVIYAEYYPTFTWFYEGFYWQYASYIIIILFGSVIFKNITLSRIAAGALGSTAIFYLISNLGCWVGSTFYPQNISGLLACYAAGIPFAKATLLGDLIYSGVLFGAFYLAQIKFPRLVKA
jgi:hypothetical protein